MMSICMSLRTTTFLEKISDKIYDYELVESGLPGQPIGRIVRNADGKETIKLF